MIIHYILEGGCDYVRFEKFHCGKSMREDVTESNAPAQRADISKLALSFLLT